MTDQAMANLVLVLVGGVAVAIAAVLLLLGVARLTRPKQHVDVPAELAEEAVEATPAEAEPALTEAPEPTPAQVPQPRAAEPSPEPRLEVAAKPH